MNNFTKSFKQQAEELEQKQLTQKELKFWKLSKDALAIAFFLCLIGCAIELLIK